MILWKLPLGLIYQLLVWLKNFLYDAGLADALRVDAKVISVGNLTVGGTGKTPVVEEVILAAENRGQRAALVSRNYRSQSHGTHRIERSSKRGASFYGDEAFLIANRHPTAAVYVGPSKWFSAFQAANEVRPQLIIIDDGFQHRALHRDFDIVLLDATKDWKHYRLLPWGRAREGWSSLARAHLVILTKANLVSTERCEELHRKVPKGVPVSVVDYKVSFASEKIEGARFFAFCGLADPEAFEKSLTHVRVAEFARFRDHHCYKASDIKKLEDRARHLGCEKILTTMKDYIKIQEIPHTKEFFEQVELKLEWRDEPKELYAFLDKVR